MDAQFSWRAGLVPPFRTAARDRGRAALGAVGVLGPVELSVEGDVLRDRSADGEVVAGPGDLRLGTVARVPFGHGVSGALGWEVKLPDAADEGELGTDETDVSFGATVAWNRGPWWASGSVGLGIFGNPLRFANQDDVPLLRGAGGWRAARWSVDGAFRGDVGTSRNPARFEAGGHVGYGRRVEVRAGGGFGLTPAAADWGVDLGVVVRLPFVAPPLPETPSGG